MKIIIQGDSDNKKELLSALEIIEKEFTLVDIFDNKECCYIIPKYDNTLVVLDTHSLHQLFETDVGIESVFSFLENITNNLWVYQDMDSTIALCQSPSMKKILYNIDKKCKNSNFCIIHDSHLTKNVFFHSFKNIKNYIRPVNNFIKFPALSKKIKKNTDSKPFLITTILKSGRNHRKTFIDQLMTRNTLKHEKNIIVHDCYNNQKESIIDESWVGEKTRVHDWQDGNPSMDLYNDSYFELIPETAYKQLYFITEKTIKPIATMTPFLILSTMGYLNFLRKMGFKTFDGIIDESYDLEERVEDRSRMILDELENILYRGPKTVYEECLPILEHNFHHLMYLTGSYDFKTNEFFRECLDSTFQKHQ